MWGKSFPIGGGSFLQNMSEIGLYVFKISIKAWWRRWSWESRTRGQKGACGFMIKTMGARQSLVHAWNGQIKLGGERLKKAHFQEREGRILVARMGGVGCTRDGQRKALGYGYKPFESRARIWSVCVCVCVCMRSSTHEAFHESLRSFLIKWTH